MFQELYFYRWPVELKYKELKSRLAIEEFSGATTTSVFQEFYINMLLSNLSSLIKNQANRAFIIGFMKRLLPKILCTISTIDEINRLYSEAVRNRSQIMPGRTFKRKKNKANPNAHFCPVLSFIEIPPKNPLYLNTSIAECHVKYNIYDFLPCPNSALISVQQLLISLPQ